MNDGRPKADAGHDLGEERTAIAALVPAARPIDLSVASRVHIVGIGGAGMRAIARVLHAMGHKVSGSDRRPSIELDRLAEIGIDVSPSSRPELVATCALVTRSTAVPDEDAEIVAAERAGVVVYSRAEILAAISSARPAILVAGTHGKTTTSSMLAVLLDHAELDPSFIIGADVARFSSGARWSSGPWSVIEADESDGTFLCLTAAHGIVTSVDPDHLDFYGDVATLNEAFAAFVAKIPGTVAICVDDADAARLSGSNVVTYGLSESAELRLVPVIDKPDCYDVRWRSTPIGTLQLPLPGHHNARNAAGCLAITLAIGVDPEVAIEGAAAFTGVRRRFEHRGSLHGVDFVDDYAHLPAEVEACLQAAANGRWTRVFAVHQPHRYTRTLDHAASFARSFDQADETIICELYTAGETPIPEVTAALVSRAVSETGTTSVRWIPDRDAVAIALADELQPGDLCLSIGAGDITDLADDVQARMRAGVPEPQRVLDDAAIRVLDQLAGSVGLGAEASVGALTTYRVGGRALATITVNAEEELLAAIRSARSLDVAVLLVGRGSNMLVADSGWNGIAVVLGSGYTQVEIDHVGGRVIVGAGASMPAVARQTANAGLAGFEWAVGVPGSLGGAVTMNAGGHGSDMAAAVQQVTVVDLVTGISRVMTANDLQFGYRRSAITSRDCVTEVVLALRPGNPDDSAAQMSEIVAWRREHQPGGQNAGSVFANPTGDSAGRLIDSAGCKGMRVGSAAVSAKHANFIQADPGGSADDVAALMARVHERVRAVHDIALIPETRLVGFGHRQFPWSSKETT